MKTSEGSLRNKFLHFATRDEDTRGPFLTWCLVMTGAIILSMVERAHLHIIWNFFAVLGTAIYGVFFYYKNVAKAVDEKNRSRLARGAPALSALRSIGITIKLSSWVLISSILALLPLGAQLYEIISRWIVQSPQDSSAIGAALEGGVVTFLAVVSSAAIPYAFLRADLQVSDMLEEQGDNGSSESDEGTPRDQAELGEFKRYALLTDVPTFMAMLAVISLYAFFRFSAIGIDPCQHLLEAISDLSNESGPGDGILGLCQACLVEMKIERADAFFGGATAFQFIAFNLAFTCMGVYHATPRSQVGE